MKFAHLADAHLGGWREPKLRDANTQSFNACIDTCITEKVDFVIIAGDLFNTSMPGIDSLRVAVQKLKDLQNAKIPTYYIAGSHDSSPSGKTMLDVLEDAGLCINLVRGTVVDGLLNLSFTTDPKTGVKLTGILGKKGGLDKHYYTDLAREPLEKETGTKIFVFHCALNELKPKELADMDAMSVSLFPKGFAYYAGGHVHVVDKGMLGTHDNIIYPGPVFPNNFAELEKLKHGTFVIYEDGAITHRKLSIYPVISLRIDATGKSPLDVEHMVHDALNAQALTTAIVTLRIEGTLASGKPSDIHFNDLTQAAQQQGAYVVLKNTAALTSKEFIGVQVAHSSVQDIEETLIREHTGTTFKTEQQYLKALLRTLSAERDEGEKLADFEKRVLQDAQQTLATALEPESPTSPTNS